MAFLAQGDEVQSAPVGTTGYDQPFDGHDYEGNPVHLDATRRLAADEEVDLTSDIQANYNFFESGPGYDALDD